MTHNEGNVSTQAGTSDLTAGLIGLVVLAGVAWGLYVLGMKAYAALFPPPAEASVSLSAGFDEADVPVRTPSPVVAENPQKESGSGAAAAGTEAPAGSEPAKTEPQKTKPAKVQPAKADANPPQTVHRTFFYIQGNVQKLGEPVKSGMVKLTVEKLIGDFRKSELVGIKDGSFYTSLYEIKPDDKIRVQAEVWSHELPLPPLTEELYLGSAAPLPIRNTLYVIGGTAVLVSIFVFAYAFTGPQNPRKNRTAIIYSYVVILVALLIPLIGPYTLVHAFPGLEVAMRDTPAGLVVAKPDADSQDSQPQWLLNIGGIVVQSKPDPAKVIGGLAIPLYVIVLSLMGGTINMTRQVPLMQNQAQNATFDIRPMLSAWREAIPWRKSGSPGDSGEESDAGKMGGGPVLQIADRRTDDWRTGLLNQYMYLLSAPFIAIATYYMLYLLGATRVPILVLVSFSVGLISEHILVAITDFADTVIGGLKEKKQLRELALKEEVEAASDEARAAQEDHAGQPAAPGEAEFQAPAGQDGAAGPQAPSPEEEQGGSG